MKYQMFRMSIQHIVAHCIIKLEPASRLPPVARMTLQRQTAEGDNNDRRKCYFMQRL